MNQLFNISLCLILTLNFGYSQSIKRSVLCSYGASSNTTNSIVETTFGQPPNIGTITDGTYFIRQGFQQPLYNLIPVLFCENFESYSPGSYLAATSSNWITWTQPYTASEDIQVTNALSNSGTNSIFFNGTSSPGGPSDVVLPFSSSTPYTNGFFSFRSNFYVMNGAYFNFQAETTAGITWALDVGMNNGTINFGTYPGSWTAVYLSSTYPTNQWFELKIEIDLNSNSWEVFIDGVSQGSFANPTNQIASLDLYPLSGNQFYVDDICFEYSTTPISTYGCTDSLAINYNASANIDDGSCIYCTNDTSYTYITSCDSYLWNSTIYTTSGAYTYATTNASGCDSTAILNLTINNSTATSTSITACDSYTW